MEAIAVATPAASRAITVAGITLAATFALLALVPLRPFKELALLMALGVLIDALFVRPLLIPALIALAGRGTWWPSRLRPEVSTRRLYREAGREITDATLLTLGERLPEREAEELARHVPMPLGDHGQTFGSDEFIARVADRAHTTTTDAQHGAAAVIEALRSTLPAGELEYVMAALPAEYAWLFGERPVEPEVSRA